MKSVDRLTFSENNWETDKGAWFPGESVLYRNLNLFTDFKDKSWICLLMFGITGRMPKNNESKLVEEIWKLSTSFPDPRLWNNRVAALAGTARSTGNLALASATAISEATIFGRRADIRTIDFLKKIRQLEINANDIDDYLLGYLKKYRALPGFGRPVVSNDERIAPLMEIVDSLGFDSGPHLLMINRIENFLTKNKYRFKANIAAYCAALLADIGFNQREYYLIALLSFSAGIIPCYLDGAEHSEGSFFPLRCEVINHVGTKNRKWG